MTIVKQISLFDIQELFEMESSHRFDAIFATFDVQPIFQLFSKKTMRGAPRECNYGAMIQSLIIRIVERIPTVKDLVKRLVNDPLFRLDCGFLVSDSVPSEASYSRMIDVISRSDVMDNMQDQLILTAFSEGFLEDLHVAHDATHFEARDASKPSQKKKHHRKNVDANQKRNVLLGSLNKQKSKRIKRLTKRIWRPNCQFQLTHFGKIFRLNPTGVSKRIAMVRIRSGMVLKDI